MARARRATLNSCRARAAGRRAAAGPARPEQRERKKEHFEFSPKPPTEAAPSLRLISQKSLSLSLSLVSLSLSLSLVLLVRGRHWSKDAPLERTRPIWTMESVEKSRLVRTRRALFTSQSLETRLDHSLPKFKTRLPSIDAVVRRRFEKPPRRPTGRPPSRLRPPPVESLYRVSPALSRVDVVVVVGVCFATLFHALSNTMRNGKRQTWREMIRRECVFYTRERKRERERGNLGKSAPRARREGRRPRARPGPKA